ncbi:hypothetical protein B7463_g9585, partial [Scytalidium lignicola]
MSPSRGHHPPSTHAANSTTQPAAPSESSTTPTTKIAIKGFSLSSKANNTTSTISGSNTTKSKIQIKPSKSPTPVLGKRPRNALHHGADDEDDGEAEQHGRHELVTGFADGGATRYEDERERRSRNQPLVIQKQANRDWRAEMRMRRGGGRNLLPPEVQAQRAAAQRGGEEGKVNGVDLVNGDEGPKWGLNVRKRETVVEERADREVEVETVTETEGVVVGNGADHEAEEPSRAKTDDELALEALMGKESKKKGPDLVIPVASEEEEDDEQRYHQPVNEADAYRRAVRDAPDVSTLEDYERVPVEEFGAALLRGMGWNGEKTAGPKDVKRRQNLLGLGASHLKGAEELGAWVQKSDTKRLKGADSKRHSGGERRPTVGEYKREKERERERREERHESYRRDRERERDRDRDYRDRDRHRDYRR